MRRPAYVLSLLSVALVAVSGCSSEPVAPLATEPLSVSVNSRIAAQGEAVPAIYVSPGTASVTIRVVSPAEAVCAPVVDAKVSRNTGRIDVVSRVSSNPAALCAAGSVTGAVVEYTGTVAVLSAGSYRVRVFEARDDGDAKLIGDGTAIVASP